MRDEYDFSNAIQGKFYSSNRPKRITVLRDEKIIPISELPKGFVENINRRIGIMHLGSDYKPEALIEMLNEDQRKELLEALQKVVKNAGNTRTSSKPTDE
jgi:hypothetical protein